MFFVLSGFLVSGLLFREHKQHGSISFKTFFIRRSFKIWQAFYVMLAVSFLVMYATHQQVHWTSLQFLSEFFYFQNYSTSYVWEHTWSLAVEEHFYILLPILLLVVLHLSSRKENPFHAVPVIFLYIAISCLVLRTIRVLQISTGLEDWKVFRVVMCPTHERIDSLFFWCFAWLCSSFLLAFVWRIIVWKSGCGGTGDTFRITALPRANVFTIQPVHADYWS